ncbi:MAG: PQQ-binding-like beta-propeller repeat protein [bacterium]|nr:PQQ-binding-like beta-propeller repeat protein [bacterium]
MSSSSPRTLALALLLSAGLVACRGGGSLPAVQTAPDAHAARVAVSLHVLVPARSGIARAPSYISPATQSLSIAVGNATPTIANLTPTSPGCTTVGGATQCTIAFQAPTGSDTFTISTYDTANAVGSALSTATLTQTIVAGSENALDVTLDGIVSKIVLAVQGSPPPEGSALDVGVSVMAQDADGNTIVGPGGYDTPITLADIDASASTALSTHSVAAPSDAVTLHYTGGALSSIGANAHLTASNPNVATSSIVTTYFVTAQDSWVTWGDDPSRSSINPGETRLSPATVGGLHTVWSKTLGGVITAAPVVVGNVAGTTQGPVDVLYVADAHANLYALNAGTGALLWQKTFHTETIDGNSTDLAQQGCFDQPGGIYGIGGSPVADAAAQRLYLVDAMGDLYALDLASGAQRTGPVQMWPYRSSDNFNITNDYGALNEDAARGIVYVPSGAHCGNRNFGGVQAYTIASGAVAHFFTEGGPVTQPIYYGGVWGPGGTALDPRVSTGSVYFATGDGPANAGQYPCRLMRLNASLGIVASSPESIAQTTCANDSDFGGSALVFAPSSSSGCASGTVLDAAENKTGTLFIYNADALASGPIQTLQIGTANTGGINLGTPIYDAARNIFFINNASDSSDGTTGIKHGLVAFTIAGCHLQLLWQQPVGPNASSDGPPSPPAVANGVVYYVDGPGSGCSAVLGSGGCPNPGAADFYAFNETSGAQLFHTTLQGPLFTQPVIVNAHVYVTSWNGFGPGVIYAFGV